MNKPIHLQLQTLKQNFIRLFSLQSALIYLIVIAIFFLNAFHESYPDEFDNITGGWYILHGVLPYSGFFTHHGPVAYFVAAFVEIFSGRSFVHFRVVYDLLLAVSLCSIGLYLDSRFGRLIARPYLYFVLLISMAATYYWGNMLLADSLSAFLLTPLYLFMVLKFITKLKIKTSDYILFSVLTSFALLSSLTYTYLTLILLGFLLYAYYLDHRPIANFLPLFKVVSIFIAPYLIFGIYLFLTGSLSSYLYDGIAFNEKYYIYNYPGVHSGFINPVRFAIVIFYDFYTSFYNLLLQTMTFNIKYPLNVTMAIVDVTTLIYFISRRKFGVFLFVFLWMIYSNARSNPLNSKETDYQSAVYIYMSLMNLCFIFSWLYGEINIQISNGKKYLLTALFLLCSIYAFFSVGLLADSFMNKFYSKYMGNAPLIYDRPDNIVAINNAVNTSSDYIWAGPFDFEDYFYMNGRLASRYHILIPGMGKSTFIQQNFLNEIGAHKPRLLFFNERFFILGSNPDMYGQYFIKFLRANYLTLSTYKVGNVTYPYSSVLKSDKYSLDVDMYIRKDVADEVVGSLLDANLIKSNYATK